MNSLLVNGSKFSDLSHYFVVYFNSSFHFLHIVCAACWTWLAFTFIFSWASASTKSPTHPSGPHSTGYYNRLRIQTGKILSHLIYQLCTILQISIWLLTTLLLQKSQLYFSCRPSLLIHTLAGNYSHLSQPPHRSLFSDRDGNIDISIYCG